MHIEKLKDTRGQYKKIWAYRFFFFFFCKADVPKACEIAAGVWDAVRVRGVAPKTF